MLLDKKTAIIYGAAGAIGSAVARAYAREGADVHLAGRTEATLDAVAQRIRTDGGTTHSHASTSSTGPRSSSTPTPSPRPAAASTPASTPPPTTTSKAHLCSTCHSRTSCAQ